MSAIDGPWHVRYGGYIDAHVVNRHTLKLEMTSLIVALVWTTDNILADVALRPFSSRITFVSDILQIG
jgi:Zn-dependent protease with chaperone function